MTVQRELFIKNRLGLHARAAIKLVELAQSFSAVITVSNDDVSATADSVMGLLMLDSAQGQKIMVSAEGNDETAALEAISALIEAGFDEES
ncbi:HPr family phosphocarrier protein [Photobacterium leiognathi]|uniref:HPr family phosphocarrier protein n=1 Tax=Photobacterium leiognathi subsp. mandapamensis TaxID=48408 RepID=A0A2T3KX14_PHOLD|nr:HPr family phosphocarrier protein [Photobacterium leiognathi]PHZ59375.1 HPr family phosphocarrier protein [Photobacterium leiognathi]PSV02290.1 HPr family phosphocarrier protein [Photobacterium leiognathi subsp. mandapamensis]PSV12027.1 HPr family phosphocarrier protein [Photobacterium leiognathi subsp. mandapamensis]PSW52183.1 HPr family phosphocarrier protein [Photobacterium leiognathi subsp. mandapamensis]PSW64667.1 HPr family phosphocarrier protein [Photobacterium leiognathi subsp. mand